MQNAEVVGHAQGDEDSSDFSCVHAAAVNADKISCGQRGYTSMVLERKKLQIFEFDE